MQVDDKAPNVGRGEEKNPTHRTMERLKVSRSLKNFMGTKRRRMWGLHMYPYWPFSCRKLDLYYIHMICIVYEGSGVEKEDRALHI